MFELFTAACFSAFFLAVIDQLIDLKMFKALASLYQRMGFIPSDVDTKPITTALADALPEVLNAR